MFEALKKFFSPSLDVPVEEPNLTGMKLINTFTNPTEPKVADYPKGKYTAFWEILVQDIPGGYTALVRFYSYTDGFLEQQQFTEPLVSKLKPLVNKHIIETMRKYER